MIIKKNCNLLRWYEEDGDDDEEEEEDGEGLALWLKL